MNIRHAVLTWACLWCISGTAFGQSIESLMNTGQTLLANGSYTQAATSFRKVLSREPGHFEARHNLGFAYLAMGRSNDAVRELKKALSLNGRSAETWANLAIAYENLGKTGQAVDALYQSVNIDPSNLTVRMNLASMYVNENRIGAAVSQFKQILDLEPDNVDARVNLAKCHIAQNNIAAARKQLERVIELSPQNAEAHGELGNLYWKHDTKPVQAEKEFRMAINLDKSSSVYYDKLGRLLTEEGKKSEAIEIYETWLIYLDDALVKEKVRARIAALQSDGANGTENDVPPEVDTEKQIADLKKNLRDDESPQEVKMMKTQPIDVLGDLEDLENESEPSSDLDLDLPE